MHSKNQKVVNHSFDTNCCAQMENSILIRTNIPAEPESVWQAITNSEHLNQIFEGLKCYCEWTVGAKVQFTQQQGKHDRVVEKGEVIRVSAQNLLEYTSFPTQMGLRDDLENYIVICYVLLDNYDGTTHLSITQKGYNYVEGGLDRYIAAQKSWKKYLPKLIAHASNLHIKSEA